MHKRVLKFLDDYKIAAIFLTKFMTAAAFGINWYHEKNYTDLNQNNEIMNLRNDNDDLKRQIEVIRDMIEDDKKAIMIDATDPQCRDNLKICGESLNRYAAKVRM